MAASAVPNNPGSWNRYAYVGGDPVNRSDRRGLDATCGPDGTFDGEGCIEDGAGGTVFSVTVTTTGGDDGDDGGTDPCTSIFLDNPTASCGGGIVTTPGGVSQSGGGGSGGSFGAAQDSFQRAASRIAKQKTFKQPCDGDFSALGTTAAAVQAGAANVDIENGTASPTFAFLNE
jgi:hypothetical protein